MNLREEIRMDTEDDKQKLSSQDALSGFFKRKHVCFEWPARAFCCYGPVRSIYEITKHNIFSVKLPPATSDDAWCLDAGDVRYVLLIKLVLKN